MCTGKGYQAYSDTMQYALGFTSHTGTRVQAIADGAPEAAVTVKCRIGVDDVDDYASLHTFIRTVSNNSPVEHFVVHARKCLLKGLNPHQNRTIPPLRYDATELLSLFAVVYCCPHCMCLMKMKRPVVCEFRYEWVFALKQDFPHLEFSLNGGIQSWEEVNEILATEQDAATVHGVMLGRAAFNMPWHVLGCADTRVFGCDTDPAISRRQVRCSQSTECLGMSACCAHQFVQRKSLYELQHLCIMIGCRSAAVGCITACHPCLLCADESCEWSMCEVWLASLALSCLKESPLGRCKSVFWPHAGHCGL